MSKLLQRHLSIQQIELLEELKRMEGLFDIIVLKVRHRISPVTSLPPDNSLLNALTFCGQASAAFSTGFRRLEDAIEGSSVISEVPSSAPTSVKAPTLSDLKSKPCTLEELQASLVQLIELHNAESKNLKEVIDDMQATIRRKADKEWRASI